MVDSQMCPFYLSLRVWRNEKTIRHQTKTMTNVNQSSRSSSSVSSKKTEDEYFGNDVVCLVCIDRRAKNVGPIGIAKRHIVAAYPYSKTSQLSKRLNKEYCYKLETSIGTFLVASNYEWEDFTYKLFETIDDDSDYEEESTSDESTSSEFLIGATSSDIEPKFDAEITK